MKKAWRIVSMTVVIMLILGGVCLGVGLLTGADTDRIYQVLDNRYGITVVADTFGPFIKDEFIPWVKEIVGIIFGGW